MAGVSGIEPTLLWNAAQVFTLLWCLNTKFIFFFFLTKCDSCVYMYIYYPLLLLQLFCAILWFNIILNMCLQVMSKVWSDVWWTTWTLWWTIWSLSMWKMILCCQSTSPRQSATLWMIYGRGPSWTSLVSNSPLHSLAMRLTNKSTETVTSTVNV